MDGRREARTAEHDAAIAQQIVRLLGRRSTVVWELVAAPAHRQADDVTIRDLGGTLVAYARPSVK
jgi:hypothetical protein